MDLEFARQFQLGDPAQILFQNGALDLQLMLVSDVLVMAAAAAREVWTPWFNPARRWVENVFNPGTGEPRSLFDQRRLNSLFLYDERQEDSLAPSMFVGRKTCKSIAAVDELLDLEFQDSILRNGEGPWRCMIPIGFFPLPPQRPMPTGN